MSLPASIFLDFNLPNATTWFYFSLLLAVALFFKFSRLLSVRNMDVLTLFLLVPGLLLLLDARARSSDQLRLLGYVWLLAGSAYFLIRCLLDLALVRRPALSPNLNAAGLAWMGGALFVSLLAVAVREPTAFPHQQAKTPAPVEQVQRQLNQQAVPNDPDSVEAKIWVERGLTLLCHLAVVAGLVVVGWRHFQDLHGGMAAAAFYLLLPYTFLLLPYAALRVGHWHHVWPMALMVWAVAVYRAPAAAGFLHGLAAGSVYFPALVFPVWFSFYRGRGVGRFTAAFLLAAGFSLAFTGAILWAQGDLDNSVRSALHLSDWQPWRAPNTEGFWTNVLPWAYRIPLFVVYTAFILLTLFWPAPKNLAHVVALSSAALIGLQFWYADHGGVYVLWYLPLYLLMVFRPNLEDRVPPLIDSDTDWLSRLGRRLRRFGKPLMRTAGKVAGQPPVVAGVR